jgi:hypothetical protein
MIVVDTTDEAEIQHDHPIEEFGHTHVAVISTGWVLKKQDV